MNKVELIANYMSNIYGIIDAKKRQSFINKSIGAIYIKKDSKDHLISLGIQDFDKISKSNKNIIYDIVENNPYAADIVDNINKKLLQNPKNIESLNNVLKNINTIKEFLKTSPYDEPIFVKKILKQIITWGFNNDNMEIKVLQNGFNLYLDKETLSNFIGLDTVKSENASKVIQQANEIYKQKEVKDTIMSGTAGLVTIAVMGGAFQSLMSETMPSITNHISSLNKIATFAPLQVASMSSYIISASPAILWGLAFYSTFSMLNKSFKTFVDEERSSKILLGEPEKISDNAMKSILGNKIFAEMSQDSFFDISDVKNKEYIALCLFMNEKLFNPSLNVSPKLKTLLSLNTDEEKNLNNLTLDNLHKIINVPNPQIRRYMLLNKISDNMESILKEMAYTEVLLSVDNKKGKYFSNIVRTNVSPQFTNKVNALKKTDKYIIDFYLNIFTDKNGVCNKEILESLEIGINNNNFLSGMRMQINKKITNQIQDKQENKELGYFKKAGEWILGTGTDHLLKTNEEVLKAVIDNASKLGYTEHTKVLVLNPPLSTQIKNKTIEVLYKIGEMRDKFKKTIGLDVSNTITYRS